MIQQIDDLFNDAPFTVFVSIGDEGKEFDVIPSYESDISQFLIILDGVSVGTLYMNDNEQWRWINSNLSDDNAEAIGNKINHHYD